MLNYLTDPQLNDQENIFIDEKIQPGKSFKYEISAMDNDKLESPKSEKVAVKVPKEK